MTERIDTLIAELERQERTLAKVRKPSALDQLRLLAVRCDLAVRRRDRATQHLDDLHARVEQAKRELSTQEPPARASGRRLVPSRGPSGLSTTGTPSWRRSCLANS